MKHLKLFESFSIEKRDFPKGGNYLNSREREILVDLVGSKFLREFEIRKEDNYYYTSFRESSYNQLDGFNELKDYILCRYYLENNKPNELLELLKITDLDPSLDKNCLIKWTIYYGYLEIVKHLLKDPRVDPSNRDNFAIKWASEKGYTEIVKLLLQDPRVDPSAEYNICIMWASQKGHTEVVKLLLKDPRVDPSGNYNEAIKKASKYEFYEIVKLLLEDPRVRSKLTSQEINRYTYLVNEPHKITI